MKGLAIRRHHRHRMRVKARRIYKGNPRAPRYADNLALCSCWMCGNQRRHAKGLEKLTLKERKIAERLEDKPTEE